MAIESPQPESTFSRFLYKDASSPSRPPAPANSPLTYTGKRNLRSTDTPLPTSQSRSPPKRRRKNADTPHPRSPTSQGKPQRPSADRPPLQNKLTDSLAPGLICVFVGVNPGIRTATSGHAYAHPSNLFWKLAYSSGCTPRLCRPEEDGDLPRLYALGHTNIVTRPTRDASQLSQQEMDAGVAVLEGKVTRFRPECVCLVGKSIWEAVWRVRHGRKIRKEEFRYGWQEEAENMGLRGGAGGEESEDGWAGARIFVATTTSGLAAGMRPQEKEEVWKGLGEFVKKRRKERCIPDEGMQ